MATIITRETGATAKGSPLTNAEVDANFINLNTEITPSHPSIFPTLNLDFNNSQSVDSRIVFSRASNALHYDKRGVLVTKPQNTSRIDFNPNNGECKGLLLEEQRTNLLTNSSEFKNWTSYRNYLRSAAAIAPDGTYSAYRNSSASATIDGGGVFQQGSFTFLSATTYTFSIFVKPDGATGLSIGFTDQSAGGYAGGQANFDLTWSTNPVIGGRAVSATSIDIGSGWRRLILVFTTKTAPDFHYVFANIITPTNTEANGVFIWGAQLEQGGFATSYIPSVETFLSRSGNATYVNSLGIVCTAGLNTPRLNYVYDVIASKWTLQGALFEPSATNLISYSNPSSRIDGSGSDTWVYGSNGTGSISFVRNTNESLAPDNSNTAIKAILSSGAGTTSSDSASLTFFKNGGITLSVAYTASIWVKAVPGHSGKQIQMRTVRGSQYTKFTLTDYWQRILLTEIANTTDTSIEIVIRQGTVNADGSNSVNSSVAFYAWGAQLETGSAATSLIHTHGATATRAADVISSTQSTRAPETLVLDVSNIYRASGFTLIGEVETFGANAGRIVAFAPNSTDTSNVLSVNFETTYFRTYQYVNSGLRFNTAGAGYVANTFLKFGLGVSPGAFSTIVNGYKETGSGSVEYAMNSMRIGSMNGNQYTMSGHIKKLAYYSQKLTDSQITAATL